MREVEGRPLYRYKYFPWIRPADLLPLPDQKMEPRCMNEFWINNMDKLNRMQVHAKPAQEQMKRFRDLLDKWDTTHDLYIVADNPGFDFGFVGSS